MLDTTPSAHLKDNLNSLTKKAMAHSDAKKGYTQAKILETFIEDVCPQIPKSSLQCLRICWVFAYFMGFCLFAYQMTPLFQKYLSRQTMTSIELTTATSLDFPAVTICNPIFLKKSKIRAIRNYSELANLDDVEKFMLLKKYNPRLTCNFTIFNMKQCGDDKLNCIPDFMFCDGSKDCMNGYDEKDSICNTNSDSVCQYGFYSCHSQYQYECVSEEMICNGERDCSNGWDENSKAQNKTCTPRLQCGGEFEIVPNESKTFKIPVLDNGFYSNIVTCIWQFIVSDFKDITIYFNDIDIKAKANVSILNETRHVLHTIDEYSGYYDVYTLYNVKKFFVRFMSDSIFVGTGLTFEINATSTAEKRKKRSYVNRNSSDYDYYQHNYNNIYGENFLGNTTLDVGDWRHALALSNLPDHSDIVTLTLFSEEDLKRFGVRASDLIAHCTYDSSICSSNFFQFVSSKTSGSCFTFNSGFNAQGKKNEIRRTVRTGNQYGLKLTLFLEASETIGILKQDDGALLSIADNHIPKSDSINSVSIMPGHVTIISLRKKVITRSPNPYSNCSAKWPDFEIFPSDLEEKSYLYETCLDVCIQNYLWATCNCLDDYLFNNTFPLCDMWNSGVQNCKLGVYKMFAEGKLDCNEKCTAACEDIVFQLSVSYKPWPSEAYLPYFLQSLIETSESGSDLQNLLLDLLSVVIHNKDIDTNKVLQIIKKNFARVEIYYEMLNYEHIKQEPAYQFFELIADFGGNLGLWIGWSALVLMEIVELIVESIWFRRNRKVRKTKPECTTTL